MADPPSFSLRSQVRQMSQASADTWAKDEDLQSAVEKHRERKHTWPMFWGLSYRAVGVIFGDLGTSPLYTLPTTFARQPSRLAIYGSCSLILWIILLQLIVKYICITLYADDHGEGGTFAVLTLLNRHIGIAAPGEEVISDSIHQRSSACQSPHSARTSKVACYIKQHPMAQHGLLLLALFGTAMLVGDGMLTCSIEVISAVSGLNFKASLSQGAVVGISCGILLCLFCIQQLGTSKIGLLFSPVLLAWFIINAAIGVYNIAKYEPGIFAAFNPAFGIRYLVHEGKEAWISLGGIILCVTGAEAMFIDMGHFSRAAVQFTTVAVVLPSCLLIYLGEAAYLTKFPGQFANPFFASIPAPLFWPVFVIATAASIVAAQSLITATFSIVKQSMALNCFPPVKLIHTSSTVAGQVYLPAVNWSLMVGSIAIVAAFGSTASIGNAFGVAFIAVMITTTLLVALVQLVVWKLHPALPIAFLVCFLALEGVPASALLYKVPAGAWFPLVLGAVVLAISCLWHYGASQHSAQSRMHSMQLESLLQPFPEGGFSGVRLVSNGLQLSRVPGLALFYSKGVNSVPPAFGCLITKLQALHETVVFITVRQVSLPSVPLQDRFLIKPLPVQGLFRVVTRYGYQDCVDHGPQFLTELTTRIAAVVRYPAMMGKSMADSAADIPTADVASSSFAAGGSEKGNSRAEGAPVSMTSGQPAPHEATSLTVMADSAAEILPSSMPPPLATIPDARSFPAEGSHPLQPAGVSQGKSLTGVSKPLIGQKVDQEAKGLLAQQDLEADAATQAVRAAQNGVVYVLSKSTVTVKQGYLKRLALETLYPLLLRNTRAPTAGWKLPAVDVIQICLTREM